MLAKLNDILKLFKNKKVKLDKSNLKIISIINKILYENEKLNAVINAYKKRFADEITVLKITAIFEKNTKIIKNEIQPATPFIRKYNNLTIRDFVYK